MESSVGEDGDETGDSIVMAVLEKEQQFLEQEAFAIQIIGEAEGVFVQVLQRDEVTVLLEEGFFPIVEVECEVWQRGELVVAEQVDSEFDVSTVVRGGNRGSVLVEPAEV